MSAPFVFIDIAVSALPGVHAHDACPGCGNPYGYLGRYLKADGSVGIRWVCEHCGKCTACHREWHARMRAHGLRWPHELTEQLVPL
jgi:hypothetical protein